MDITSDNVFVYLECEFCTGLFPVDGIELHIKIGHEDEMQRVLSISSRLVPVRRAFAVTELPDYNQLNNTGVFGTQRPPVNAKLQLQDNDDLHDLTTPQATHIPSDYAQTANTTCHEEIHVKNELPDSHDDTIPDVIGEATSSSGCTSDRSESNTNASTQQQQSTDVEDAHARCCGPISMETRERIVKHYEDHKIAKNIAVLVNVHLTCVLDVLHMWTEHGTLEGPIQHRNKCCGKTKTRSLPVNSEPDAYSTHLYKEGGHRLSIEVKQMIVKHHQEGMRNMDIAELLNCKRTLISYVIYIWKKYGTVVWKEVEAIKSRASSTSKVELDQKASSVDDDDADPAWTPTAETSNRTKTRTSPRIKQQPTNSNPDQDCDAPTNRQQMSMETRQLIVKYHEEGKSQKAIRTLLDCHHETVSNVIHMWTVHNTLEGPTRPRKRCCGRRKSASYGNFGMAVFVKSKNTNDMVRYESEVHPGRVYEFFRQEVRGDQTYYSCVTCTHNSAQARKNTGTVLPRPLIHVRNGMLITDPDNPTWPHHCQGVSMVYVHVRDSVREMHEYAYTNGAKLGTAGVYQYGRNRLERAIADLSLVDKEQARQRFPLSRRSIQRYIKKGCIERGEPLPESFAKYNASRNNKPKRVCAKVVPRAYLAGDGYVVNDVNYVQHSTQSQSRKWKLKRALEAGQTIDHQHKRIAVGSNADSESDDQKEEDYNVIP